MENKLILLVCILLIFIIQEFEGGHASVLKRERNPVDDNGLATFLNTSMNNYLDWLRANNLDPTPPSVMEFPMVTDNPLYYLVYVTENEQLIGYTNLSDTWNVNEITADYEKRVFSVGIKSKGKLSLEGTFLAVGFTIPDGQRITVSDGNWHVETTGTLVERYTFDFEVQADSSIVLGDCPKNVENRIKLNETATQFEGLWDNLPKPYPVEIRREITWGITDRFARWYESHPTGRLLHEYLQQAFSNIE